MSRSRRDISGTHTAAESSIGTVAVSAATAVSTLPATRASRTAIAGFPRASRAPNRSSNGEPRYLTRPVTVLIASSAPPHARAPYDRRESRHHLAPRRYQGIVGAPRRSHTLVASRRTAAGAAGRTPDVTSVHDAVCSQAVP